MNKKMIILSGKQFSGKDTVAAMLLKLLPGFERIGIGDAIKIEYSRRTGLSLEEIEKNKSNYRPDLIALGDEGRAKDPDYWLKKIIDYENSVIVPDIRLPHELELFKKHGAISIRVESSREARANRGTLVKEDDTTEVALDNVKDWDYVIENNSGLEELTSQVEKIADDIRRKIA